MKGTAVTTPVQIIFVGSDNATQRRAPINSDLKAQEIVSTLPGWDKIAEIANRLQNPSPVPEKHNHFDLVQRVLDGESVVDVAKVGIENTTISLLSQEAGSLLNSARQMHTNNVLDWLDANADKATAAVLKRLTTIVSKATKLLPDLDGVQAASDLAQKPSAASAWAELLELGLEFTAWRATLTPLTGIVGVGWESWPYADLFANYTDVWPDYYLRNGAHFSFTNYTHPVPASIPPWQGLDATQLLRFIAAHNIELWLPTREQLEERTRELNEQQQTDMKALMERVRSERVQRHASSSRSRVVLQ
jgi:hypothetical protein